MQAYIGKSKTSMLTLFSVLMNMHNICFYYVTDNKEFIENKQMQNVHIKG